MTNDTFIEDPKSYPLKTPPRDCAKQSFRQLPNFGRSPKLGSFQKIAQNFCAISKIGQKRPKKLPNYTKTLKKLPKIAQNFYIFVKSAQNSSQKTPNFFKIGQNFSVFVKSTLKAPEKLPNSGEISIW